MSRNKKAKVKQFAPTEEERISALNKVLYSIEMSIFIFHFVNFGEIEAPVYESAMLRNCLLESLLTHTRNLNAFFYPVNARHDDIIIQHFTDAFDGRANKFTAEINRISKALSHLTYYENKYKDSPKWYPLEIAKMIFPDCCEFMKLDWIDNDRLRNSFSNIEQITNDLEDILKAPNLNNP